MPGLGRALDMMSLNAVGPITDMLLDTASVSQSALLVLTHPTAPGPNFVNTQRSQPSPQIENSKACHRLVFLPFPSPGRQRSAALLFCADNDNNSNNSHLGHQQGPSGDSGSCDCPPLAWKADATGC